MEALFIIRLLAAGQLSFSFLVLLLFAFQAKKTKLLFVLTTISALFSISSIVFLWIKFQKPPFETFYETKLWFAFFVLLVGLVLYFSTKEKCVLLFSNCLNIVFVALNLFNPQTFDSLLPPALQSPWFIPHVSIYIIAYSILGISCCGSVVSLLKKENKLDVVFMNKIGLLFLVCACLLGALWANEIWADFWSWDIKEVFALINSLVYLLLIIKSFPPKIVHWLNIGAFLLLLFTWIGLKHFAYNSLHIYA